MFFGKSDQIGNLDRFTFISDDLPRIMSENLVHLAENDSQVGARLAVFEGDEIEL
jgi:hypothetical protein